jgi:preprotein translocase subunit SecD
VAGATTTTVDGAPSTTTPVISDPTQQQVLPLRGGGQCLVGPAGGTGAVFENDATADIINSTWGVRVGLRGGAEGADVWNQLAAQCATASASCPSRQLAIELDGEIISAPTVENTNFNNGVQITGSFTESEAKDLANVLRSGSLPVRMETQSVQNVSPTLGKDSLRAALIAGLVGVILVLVLLVLYYRHLGLVVAAGLFVSGSIVYSIISLLSRTQGLALSLAGVAGIIVSVGVTVDSYVVFFERLKDEVRAGRTLRNSAQRGFAGAWRTILIADTVSLIGAFTLWYLTVGAVRNFAFFLGLSTLIDLVVSYFFTRPAVLLLAGTDWMAKRKVMGIEVTQSPSPSPSPSTAIAGGVS